MDLIATLECVSLPKLASGEDALGRRTSLGRASQLGFFVRRFILAMKMGSFQATSRLYDQLLLYIDQDVLSEPVYLGLEDAMPQST
jgi:hypothetical protein